MELIISPSPHKNNSPTLRPFFCQHHQVPKLKIAYLTINHLSYFSASTLLFRVSTCRGLDNGLQCPPRTSWSLNPVGDVQSLACLTSHLRLKKQQLSKHRSFSTLLHHSLPCLRSPWSHSGLPLACHSLIACAGFWPRSSSILIPSTLPG